MLYKCYRPQSVRGKVPHEARCHGDDGDKLLRTLKEMQTSMSPGFGIVLALALVHLA